MADDGKKLSKAMKKKMKKQKLAEKITNEETLKGSLYIVLSILFINIGCISSDHVATVNVNKPTRPTCETRGPTPIH